ncbi:hypothetical protein BJX63DRAFT_68277 [Aspergillus granulosus]|uniref:Uncharacterized protein n=1 Tax=Aspergillus granulosus TaxID=176169 RepID=A0ABR4GX58_9EURO
MMAVVLQSDDPLDLLNLELDDDLNTGFALDDPDDAPRSEIVSTLDHELPSDESHELSKSEIGRLVNILPPLLNHDDKSYNSLEPTADLTRHASHVSFGDGTISATSGAFGSILRISQYVDRADFTSRMVALDYIDAPPPFCIVARADDLLNQAQSPRNGFGMRVSQATGDTGTEGLTTPSLTFLGDRWPRIRYTVNDVLDFRVDLVCHDHMVVQRMRITNRSPFKQISSLEFDPRFLLRDLDYTTRKADRPLEYRRGPYGRSLVVMEHGPSKIHGNLLDVVIGLFKDGDAQELKDASVLSIKHELNYQGSVEYVSVFKIQRRDPSFGWKDLVIPNAEVNQCFKQMPIELTNWEWPRTTDMHLRWSLRRNLEHILGPCSVHLPTEGPAQDSAHVTAKAPSVNVVDKTLSQRPVSIQRNEGPQIILETPEGDSYLVQELDPNSFDLQKMDESRGSSEQQRTHKLPMTDKPQEEPEPRIDSAPDIVSLTCGDFGDHRVCTSGSYFAFMFMLKMYQQASLCTLQETGEREWCSAQESMRRIHETCRGHLKWVSRLARRDGLSSNLWVDGTIIPSSSDTLLPPDSPANMPYHILKVTEYLKVFKDRDELIFVCGWLPRLVQMWVEHLRLTKNRLSPTWEHLRNISDIPIYRLSDHTWIWKALQDIQDLIKRVQEEKRTSQGKTGISQEDRMTLGANQPLSIGALDGFLRDVGPLFPSLRMRGSLSIHALDFTVDDMRKQNLRRFTLENDVLKKRMLSVTRSARETRFLFHSRDTVLYYGKTWGFVKQDQLDLFEQLVKAQIQHNEEGTDEARWDNPLRYALALLMAHSNHQLDRDFEPHDMIIHAMDVIRNSSSESGLYPGQLEPSTKEAALFDRELYRDFYFHCGFEIPYILLLVSAGSHHDATKNLKQNDSAGETSGGEKSTAPLLKKSTEVPTKVLEKALVSQERGDSGTASERLTVLVQRSLKRQNPLGRLVDTSNIVDVPEEWLYKYPDFLDYEPPDISDIESIIRDGQLLLGNKRISPGDVIRQMGDAVKLPNRYSFIEDVRKSRKQHKRGGVPKSKKYEVWSFKELWGYLQQQRYAAWAKKRFVYLKSIDSVRAMICCAASPESERMSLAQFFDRHGKSKPYLHDDTAVALNLWITEVYFQFFYMLKKGQKSSAQGSAIFGQLNPSGQPICLVNTFTGFRIVGDFFDRYWTCHFIESDIDDVAHSIYDDTSHWQQRKVLELILLSRILEKVCTSTGEILDEVEGKPSQKRGSIFDDRYDSLEDRSPESLQECERILLLLKKNMIGLREVIDQWDVRESSQGRERPRWTRRDEQKYRKSIKQKRAVFEGHVRDVRAKEIHIEFLLGRVTSAQEAIRSEKSLKEAQNITLFTYVTVFFLPAGLAVSIFSMGDIPSRTVVGWMVLTATIALVITVFLLYGVIHHFHYLRRLWKSTMSALLREKPTNSEALPGNAPGKPDDDFSTKRSLKSALLSLIRLDTKGTGDDPASKHV